MKLLRRAEDSQWARLVGLGVPVVVLVVVVGPHRLLQGGSETVNCHAQGASDLTAGDSRLLASRVSCSRAALAARSRHSESEQLGAAWSQLNGGFDPCRGDPSDVHGQLLAIFLSRPGERTDVTKHHRHAFTNRRSGRSLRTAVLATWAPPRAPPANCSQEISALLKPCFGPHAACQMPPNSGRPPPVSSAT